MVTEVQVNKKDMKTIIKKHENGTIIPCIYGNECIPDISKNSMLITSSKKDFETLKKAGFLIVQADLIITTKDLDESLVQEFIEQCKYNSVLNRRYKIQSIKRWFKRLFN